MFALEQKPAKQILRKIKRTNFYYMQILIIISFFLLLWKGVWTYEYMDD